MPRAARKKSETNIYHIMLRGINQQTIFESYEDKDKFLSILAKCKEKSEFKLYAFCIMDNHIHLLLQADKEPLEQIFRRIGSSYVYWYNTKYHRVGHLFQDRFRSEPVSDDSYFLTVIRYIHQNPVKAGLSKAEDYRYSSYRCYLHNYSGLVDIDYPLNIFGKEEFFDSHKCVKDEKCLDIADGKLLRVTDEQALKILLEAGKISSITEFRNLSEVMQSATVIKAHVKGASIRQLSLLTGMSKGIIEKILR